MAGEFSLHAAAGEFPLHAAARGWGGSLERLEELLGAVPVDLVDSRGDTALHVAARHGRAAHAQVLVAAGASVRAINGDGDRPCDVASNTQIEALLAPARFVKKA